MDSYSIAETRESISDITDRVSHTHERIMITKHGRPCAVVISPDDLESLSETIAILSDHKLVKDLRDSWHEGFTNENEFSKDAALALIKRDA